MLKKATVGVNSIYTEVGEFVTELFKASMIIGEVIRVGSGTTFSNFPLFWSLPHTSNKAIWNIG